MATSNGDSASLLSTQTDPTKQYEGSTMINLPLTYHSFSTAYLRNKFYATLFRVPIWSLLNASYYVIDSPSKLRQKYGVTRERVNVPSRDRRRTIRMDVYAPVAKSDKPLPVHVNWHGSGFVFDCFGADGDLCAYYANKMNCIVLDADYRKAPEHPYPAAINDAEDMMTYVFAQTDRFDIDNVTVGGSSAGANLSLVMGVLFGDKIRAVACIAPPTDFRPVSRPKKAPEPHARALTPRVALFFDGCYLTPTVDRADPRLSPACAVMSKGQLTCNTVFIAAGTGDTLHNDGVNLVENLKKQGHQNAIFHPVQGEGHGFEKAMGKGETKDKVLKLFDVICETLSSSWQGKDMAARQGPATTEDKARALL